MQSADACGRFGPFFNQRRLLHEAVMSPILTLFCETDPPYHHVMGACLYQLSDYTVVVHPKKVLGRLWGRRRKDLVLTATLMASIWVFFFGEKHLLIYYQQSGAATDIIPETLCLFFFFTVSFSLQGCNW